MRKNVLLLCILILAAGAGCGSSQRITVVTYNIHHGEGNDKKLDLPRIAGVVRSAQADLVALQEVDLGANRTEQVAQAKELARLTGLNYSFGPAMDFDGGKYGDAILSHFPIESTRVVALPWQSGNKREPRVVVVSTCLLPGGRKMLFASTHLDHTSEPSDRYLQAKGIVNAIPPGPHSPPAILAGDFNCNSESPPMQEIMKQWKLITDADPAPTCPSDIPKEKIDHILVRPADRWRVIEVKVIDERVASDHRPVMAKVELK